MEIRVNLTNRNGFETGRQLVADVEIIGGNFIEFPTNEAEYLTPPEPTDIIITDCFIEGGKRFKKIEPVGRAKELIEAAALRSF